MKFSESWILLLITFACLWLPTISKVHVGAYPSNPYPHVLRAFSIDNKSAIFLTFDNWNLDDSIYSFMLSSGFGITDETRRTMFRIGETGIREFVSKQPPHLLNTQVNEDTIAVPISIMGNSLLLVCSRFDNFTDASRRFLQQHAPALLAEVDDKRGGGEKLLKLLVSQLTIRARILTEQIEAFENENEKIYPNSTGLSLCPMSSISMIESSEGKEGGGIKSKVPTASQVLTRRFIQNGTFPTFVLNLWWNTPRRKYMLNQLTRSGLFPSSYLVSGIDSLSLTQYIYTTGLDRSAIMLEGAIASGFAHIQALKEVMKSNVPFGLILEDDVELTDGLTCHLKDVLLSPDLPADWDVIYLEYVADNYWPDDEKQNGVPEMCIDAIYNATPASFIKLDGACACGNVRAFMVSNKGARALYHLFFPLREAVDVRLRSAIYIGLVDAYLYVPPPGVPFLAKAKEASKKPGISQHVSRTYKFNDDYSEVVFTYNPAFDRDIDCHIDACALSVTSQQ